jgi:anhydro-N-acetylmuramic acid kinase
VAVLNLGGIGNLSLISPRSEVLGFDCGPGNVLMDAWAQAQTGQSFDAGGAFAAEGMVHEPLLEAMLADPFFAAPPPKSTGRDLFNASWLHRHLSASHSDGLEAHDVQATLAELTAVSATQAALAGLRSWGDDFSGHQGRCELLVCGGGALNAYLMTRLQAHWPLGPTLATEARGLPAMQVEACAFAWLAQRHVQGLAGNLPSATGAKGPRILGALYPA